MPINTVRVNRDESGNLPRATAENVGMPADPEAAPAIETRRLSVFDGPARQPPRPVPAPAPEHVDPGPAIEVHKRKLNLFGE